MCVETAMTPITYESQRMIAEIGGWPSKLLLTAMPANTTWIPRLPNGSLNRDLALVNTMQLFSEMIPIVDNRYQENEKQGNS